MGLVLTLPAIAIVVAALALFAADSGGPVNAQVTGGPVILMGIDPEDGGVGAHGPISVYVSVVNDVLSNVINGGSGILVIGGGKSGSDQVTEFWDQIATDTGVSVTYVNGATAIGAQSFSGFAMIAVASSDSGTPSGGLTQAENNALAARVADVAAFVNGGGGLLGLSQSGLTSPYDYIGGLGSFTTRLALGYDSIEPTAPGLAIGITNALDICCWHDTYQTFPSFLNVLATNDDSADAGFGEAAAIGGNEVTILPEGPFGDPTCSDGIDNDADGLTDSADPDCAAPTPTPTPAATATPTPVATATAVPTPTATPVALPPTGGTPSDGGSGALPWLAAIAGAIALIGSGSAWFAYQRRRVR